MGKKAISQWIDLLSNTGFNGEIRLPVLSGSMHPVLKKGDTAVIRKTSAKEAEKMRRGAIIVIRDGYSLTAHRRLFGIPLLKIIYEKGDKNRFGSFVRSRNIVGVVTAVKSADGKMRNFLEPEEIVFAKRKAIVSMLALVKNMGLHFPRRVKGVLEKKK